MAFGHGVACGYLWVPQNPVASCEADALRAGGAIPLSTPRCLIARIGFRMMGHEAPVDAASNAPVICCLGPGQENPSRGRHSDPNDW